MWNTKGLARVPWIINSNGSQKPNFSQEQEAHVGTLGPSFSFFHFSNGKVYTYKQGKGKGESHNDHLIKKCLFLKGGVCVIHFFTDSYVLNALYT